MLPHEALMVLQMYIATMPSPTLPLCKYTVGSKYTALKHLFSYQMSYFSFMSIKGNLYYLLSLVQRP